MLNFSKHFLQIFVKIFFTIFAIIKKNDYRYGNQTRCQTIFIEAATNMEKKTPLFYDKEYIFCN
jgi:hypothetical protein